MTVAQGQHLDARPQVDANQLRVLAQSLVDIPSPNPPGHTAEVVEVAATFLRDAGIAFKKLTKAPGKVNLIADVHGGKPGTHVIMNAHLDVFPDSPMSSDGGSGILREPSSADWITGRGAVDMKGGAAAFLMVLRALKQQEAALHGRASLLLVCDEETFGPNGSKAVLEEWPEYAGDVLLSSEPSSLQVIRKGERGFLWLHVHFSTPHGGHGAYSTSVATPIEHAANFVQSLREKFPKPARVFGQREGERAPTFLPEEADKAASKVTVSCGTIRGGTKINMQPQECNVEVDARIPLSHKTHAVLEDIANIARMHGGQIRVLNASEPTVSDEDHIAFRYLSEAVTELTGSAPMISMGMPSTDTRLWRELNVPALVYGPSPETMATSNERVSLNELVAVATVHLRTAQKLLFAPTLGKQDSRISDQETTRS